jgi:hypothetical protein
LTARSCAHGVANCAHGVANCAHGVANKVQHQAFGTAVIAAGEEIKLMSRTLLNKDVLSGLMFIAFGVFGFWISRNLTQGSAEQMGAGYMPRILCSCLVLLGAAIAIRGLKDGPPVEIGYLSRPVLILAAIVLFGLLLRPAGLFVTGFLTVVCASWATRESRILETLLLAALAALFVVGLFIYGLGLPIEPWPF